MKTFYFELPNKKQDSKGTLKNFIINRLANKYPWLSMDGIDGPKTYSSLQNAGPEDYIEFNINSKYNVSALRPHSWEQFDNNCQCYKCPFNFMKQANSYNLIDEFDIAMKKLHDYAVNEGYNIDLGYDYKLFGIPVKEYQNFIQVGNIYVPKKKNSYILPNNLKKEQKIEINNIITNIYNIVAA